MAVSTTTTKIIHVLIIAHPDDESMFFVPLLAYLRSVSKNVNRKRTTTTTKTVDDHYDDVIVWIICLTSGNYNNLGAIRENELLNVCYNYLDIQYVYLIDEPFVLPDHPNISWPINDAASMIYTALQNCLLRNQRKLFSSSNTSQAIHFNLISFDEYGVSGHCNHRDTFYAVQQFYLQRQIMSSKQQPQTQQKPQKFDFYIDSNVGDSSTSDTTAETKNATHIRINTSESLWALETVQNPILKYIPIFAWIRLIIHWICHPILHDSSYMPVVYCSSPQRLLLGATTNNNTMLLQSTTTKTSKSHHHPSDNNDDAIITIRLNRPLLNWNAMKTHASQFVWYRRLFVIFSIYTYENRIRPIKAYRRK